MKTRRHRRLEFEQLEVRQVFSALLTAADFSYQGSFRLPRGSFGESKFGWGGSALAFNANDPSTSEDDTLFMVGHIHDQMVAEVTVPAPVNSTDFAEIPTASVVQPFADVTDGLKWSELEGSVEVGGLLVNDGELLWTAYEFYDADTDAAFSHGTSPLDLSNPNDARGMYRVGTINPGFTAGYMTHVPSEWQEALGAPVLTGQSSGVLSIISRTSAGPALFGFDPDDLGAEPAPSTPLVYYQRPGDGNQELAGGMNTQNPLYNFNSSMGGVVFPEGSRSVVFFGGHATGELCYGSPTLCEDPIRGGKGWHDVGGNYIYQAWAYDVLDLIDVKNGVKEPWQIEPYSTWEINFPVPHSDARILGAAYDPHTNRVFVSQYKGDFNANRAPLIHVYEVQTDGDATPAVQLAVDQATIPEEGGVATFTATLTAPHTDAVTVNLGITGTATLADYTASATQLVIPPGETSASMTVSAIADTSWESDETVSVFVASVLGGRESGIQERTTTILDNDAETVFSVVDWAPTESGLRVQFSGELDPAALNLYDTQQSAQGAPDLTLVGESVGPVNGSLTFEPSAVTFTYTGDALPADNYTVQLRSSDDAFRGRSGLLLDGNGDGEGGDDFVASFTVAEPEAETRFITVPDLVLGPGQDLGDSKLPITISDGSEVRAVGLTIQFNPDLLQIGAATTPSGGNVVLSTLAPGLVNLLYFDSQPLPTGPVEFISLEVSVPTANPSDIYGEQQLIDLRDQVVGDGSGGVFPSLAFDAVHLASYFGDVSGNGTINATDAVQVASFVAQLETGFNASLNVDPRIVGDVSGNGRVNAADAMMVPQFASTLPGGLTLTAGIPVTRLPSNDSSTENSTPQAPALVTTADGNQTPPATEIANHRELDAVLSEEQSFLPLWELADELALSSEDPRSL